MANKNNASTGGGIGFLGLLTVLFIGLKLTNVIAWSWAWVLAPIWMPLLIALVALGGLYFIFKDEM